VVGEKRDRDLGAKLQPVHFKNASYTNGHHMLDSQNMWS
jgi:hypothetical protein